MNAGERFTLDGETTSQCGDTSSSVQVLIFAPSITDFTFSGSAPVAAETELQPRGELVFTAPYTGDWSLLASDGGACSTVSWSFTAELQRPTQVTLVGPKRARPGAFISLRGVIQGLTQGVVMIQCMHHGWKTLATLSVSPSGRYQWRTRAPRKGLWHYRAVYAGDTNHLPSSASFSVGVD